MDYMKALLIYMAATLSFAVQSTTAPAVELTPAPETAVVTEQGQADLTPQVINGVTITPGPETPTPPPVPEITPNRRYRNLANGAKGAEVRRLQERLIELGYLPEGSADGAYGRKTANAVKTFQKYNGLTADGIAGRRTQTYLYENPDVLSFPKDTPVPAETPTEMQEIPTAASANALAEELTEAPAEVPTEEPAEAPTEVLTVAPTVTPTAVPTETPAEVPTEVPTETLTATPTAVPTEAPLKGPTEAPTETSTATPTAVPTETPAEDPTEVPTETPTAVPTATLTENPAETPTRTPSAPVTSVPSTENPPADPTMYVEEIDPDTLQFEEVAGSVAYNESGAPLEWMVLEDGIRVTRKPRLQIQEGRIRVSLDDLAACIEGWNLTDDGTVVLEAEGHTLGLYNEDAGLAASVDGIELRPLADDFVFEEGHFIDAVFLAGALGGEAEWDMEERTLMLRFPGQ